MTISEMFTNTEDEIQVLRNVMEGIKTEAYPDIRLVRDKIDELATASKAAVLRITSMIQAHECSKCDGYGYLGRVTPEKPIDVAYVKTCPSCHGLGIKAE